jgi:hypothetical protein
MAEQEAPQVEEQPDASGGDVEAGQDELVNAVDDRAAQLTGAAGAAETDAPVADNRGAVADAEAHLEEKVDLADDRETLKKIQASM